MRQRTIAALAALVVCSACAEGQQPDTLLSPSAFSSISIAATSALSDPIGDARNSCPTIAPVWIQGSGETDRNYYTPIWSRIANVDTFEVTLEFTQDGHTPPRLLRRWMVSRTDIRLTPVEGSGRYLVTVRAKNRCDGLGAPSAVATVYIGNDDPVDICPWEG